MEEAATPTKSGGGRENIQKLLFWKKIKKLHITRNVIVFAEPMRPRNSLNSVDNNQNTSSISVECKPPACREYGLHRI